jgi:hypothetical protein
MSLSLAELDRAQFERTEYGPFWLCDSFDELTKLLEELPSKKGRLMSVSNVGETYLEFYASALARPQAFDMDVVEKEVAREFSRKISDYLRSTEGTIYWRIVPEKDWEDDFRVIRYDADGPDVDIYTDQKCYLDREWKRCTMYCRFVRSAKPELT